MSSAMDACCIANRSRGFPHLALVALLGLFPALACNEGAPAPPSAEGGPRTKAVTLSGAALASGASREFFELIPAGLRPSAAERATWGKTPESFGRPTLLPFMRSFHAAHRTGDWARMISVARADEDVDGHVRSLLRLAALISLPRIKGQNLPWDPAQTLDAGGFADLALCILAASDGRRGVDGMELPEPWLGHFREIWKMCYQCALSLTGTGGEVPPSAVEEIMAKQVSSMRIGQLLGDETRTSLSIAAGAWLLHRIGDEERSLSLRRQLPAGLDWPPIARSGDGYRMVLPEDAGGGAR